MTPLAVLASRVRFEEKAIFAALERRDVPYRHLDPRSLTVDLAGDAAIEQYRAVLCREISYSRRRYAGMLFEARGVPSVNASAVIDVCGDKVRTSIALHRAGVPTPRTAVALTCESAVTAAERIGFPTVSKPVTGSWGRLVSRVPDRETAQTLFEHRGALPSPQDHIGYLQELVDGAGRDIRVIVVGDEVVAAEYRITDGWRANAARGARCEPCPVTGELADLAHRAAAAVGGGVLGVDIIEGPAGPVVIEVNDAVEFRALHAAHEGRIDVADAIVDHLLELG